MSFVWTVPAKVVRVIDADSIKCQLDLGWRVFHPVTVRLKDVFAPELGTSEGEAAAEWVRDQLPIGIEVQVISRKLDKYGRTEGDILINGVSLIATLREAGFDY